MNNPLVSIIVGCYNVSKYIREGRLNDIYNQTYKNWELILVDDGSTDETGNLIDEEAKMDDRIIVIHKENGGLGSARNAGLDIARGKYIWSFDVDDHVEPKCVDYCVNEMESRLCDVLIFGFYAITPSLGTKDTIFFEESNIITNEQLRDAYFDCLLFVPYGNGFFWNKFYRRSFLDKHCLRFGDLRIEQDEVFNLKVYQHLERCYISHQVFYHYYIYYKGNNHSRFIPNRHEILKSVYYNFCELRDYWSINDVRFEAYLNNRLFNNLNDLLRSNLFHPQSVWGDKERKAELSRVMQDKDFIHAIAYKEKVGISFEDQLYLIAYRRGSIMMIKLLNYVFSNMRKLKHLIR